MALCQAVTVANRNALVRELSIQAAIFSHIAWLARAAPPAALAMPTALVRADGHTAVSAAEPVSTVATPLDAVPMPSAHWLTWAWRLHVAGNARVARVALAHAIDASPIARTILRADFDAACLGAPPLVARALAIVAPTVARAPLRAGLLLAA